MLLKNARITPMTGLPYDTILSRSVIAIEHDRIAWVGPLEQVPAAYAHHDELDVEGRLITPGLIDCHTHLVHAGNRAHEFEQRLQGVSYQEIAAAGGGILATVRATRSASESELLELALPRVDALLAEGVCTLEVKSGYGLDYETELKMLRVARQLPQQRPVRVQTSFLGAHAVPTEFQGRPDEYLVQVCIPALEQAVSEGLVDAVDAFCDRIAFNSTQLFKLFDRARELGRPVKLHADQLTNSHGAKLAARFKALSADHLEYTSASGVKALRDAKSVAVLLPGAYYTLGQSKRPPVELFRTNGVPMAVATDMNPGSSPLNSLLVAMNMACTLFRLNPAEVLAGTTANAAQALGLSDRGKIVPGFIADLAIWNVEHPAELSYRIGGSPLHQRIFGGTPAC